jgi:hypothetical protein
MNKFLNRILLFGFAFFILDKFFCIFLFTSPHFEADKRLELILNGKINKEVMVMGSSRGAYNIIAGQIEKETSMSAYNISYPGSNIEFHKFLLETLLKYNKKPKIIILSLDNPAEFLLDKTLNFRLDRLYPLVKYNYIVKELIDRKDKNQLAQFLCVARLNKGNFSLSKKRIPIESPFLPCGSMPFVHQKSENMLVYKTGLDFYPIQKEVEIKIKTFLEFQSICDKNRIKLIYCFAPNYRTYSPHLQNRIMQISKSKPFFFVYDTTNVKYKNKDYFYDESHLNLTGAKLFTSELIQYIKSKDN